MSAEQSSPAPLPQGLALLWGLRERGKRGPRPGLSTEAIVEAAVRVADAEGLEAVSMARVAKEAGYTTMSLYRHIEGKEELLQLMWNASALGAEKLVIEGDGWRGRLRQWAIIQREMLDRHPWITQMPIPAPPLAPNSLHFVEHGMAAFDGTGLPDAHRLKVIGLISSFTLNEARMAHDAMRAARAALPAGQPEAAAPPPNFDMLLRELIDESTYPHLYRLAWSADAVSELPDERAEFLWGLDRILDGIQVLIDRTSATDSALRQSRHRSIAGISFAQEPGGPASWRAWVTCRSHTSTTTCQTGGCCCPT